MADLIAAEFERITTAAEQAGRAAERMRAARMAREQRSLLDCTFGRDPCVLLDRACDNHILLEALAAAIEAGP